MLRSKVFPDFKIETGGKNSPPGLPAIDTSTLLPTKKIISAGTRSGNHGGRNCVE